MRPPTTFVQDRRNYEIDLSAANAQRRRPHPHHRCPRGPPRPTVDHWGLTELDLPACGIPEPFNIILSAGNVMTFLAASKRTEVLRRFPRHLALAGRAVVGFGAGRGYPFALFLPDAEQAGLAPDLLLSTWNLRPFREDSDFLVAVLRAATAPQP